MSEGRIQTWVEVSGRGDLEVARRSGLAATYLVSSPRVPVYGRPGDRLCVRVADSDLGPRWDALAARLPLRAGVLVSPSAEGLRLLAAMRGRDRSPLAARVANAGEARDAVQAGAEVLVAADVSALVGIRAEGTGVIPVLLEAADAGAAEAAVAAGAGGVVIPASAVAGVLGRPVLAAGMAPASASIRSAPAAATGARRRGPGAPRTATIGAALDAVARRHPDGTALVDVASARRWTWASLRHDARDVARSMLALGITPGERVVIWARNVPEWPLVHLATTGIGAILVTANPAASDEELEYLVRQSAAALLVAGPHPGPRPELLERLAGPGGPADLRAVIGLPDATDKEDRVRSWSAFLAQESGVADAQVDRAAAGGQPDDIATILYTSGTTGFPKGAQLSHRGMLQNAAAVGANLRLGADDRICLPVPFHHCFGAVMGTLAAVTYGAGVVLPSPGFEAGAALRAIQDERCTIAYGVPTMFTALLDHPARPTSDLRTLRAGIVAGAPVPRALADRAERDLHLAGLVVAYGLTEASPVVTQTSPDDPPDIRLGTVGRPIVGAEVRAIDPTTEREAAVGAPGELQTRGPMVMRGYFDMPDETNAAIDRQGWLHTGDLAVRDARGTWSIVGRLKDMVIRGGENVYPATIEAVLRRHPAVADAQVVGVPSEYYGEELFAWVVAAPGAQPGEAELRGHVGRHLARHEVPRWIRLTADFPMTGSGKVRKQDLAARAIAALGGTATGVAPTARSEAPDLPLLALKTTVLPGRAGSDVPAGTPGATDRHSPDRPPRAGWSRPQREGWRWHPRTSIEPSDTHSATPQETTMSLDDVRRRGQRIKTWGIGGNVREQIEATGEEPIMYKALGTPPQTQHPFNLYGDIRSQPDALRDTFAHRDEMDAIARELARRDFLGVIGLGSGTSQFVAQVADAAFARFAGIPGWDYDSQAFLRYPPPFDYSRMLAVPYSGSGSTVDTVAAARECRSRGAYTLAFTSVEGSPVVQASDARILTAGGFDTGGSDTFHYTTRIASAIYLALELGRLRRPGTHDFEALKAQLLDTPRLMADMFDAVDARCRTIADMFLGVRSIIVVGAGANYGTAEEIALKFDEMAHIPTKAMNPGRHIHGALGLTEESILTVLVAPPGTSNKDLLDIARVTQLLKSPAIAIVSESDTEVSDIVDYVVRIPMEDEVIFSVLAVLPGQLLPYWCGVGLGLNPDTQRSNVPKHARVWNMLFPPGTH